MIKPTIGRVVWFWASTEHSLDGEAGLAQPLASLVTFVHSDDCVNLAVFDKEGDHVPYQAIELWQGEGDRPRSLHCEWMPYQKEQSSKPKFDIEALVAKCNHFEAELASLKKLTGQVTTSVPVPPPAINLISAAAAAPNAAASPAPPPPSK